MRLSERENINWQTLSLDGDTENQMEEDQIMGRGKAVFQKKRFQKYNHEAAKINLWLV